jgi:hypothetical protein
MYSRFTGRYLHPFDALVVSAGDAEGTLAISAEARDDTQWPPFPIHPTLTYRFFADDHVVSVDGEGPRNVLRFGFDDEGRADWLLYDFRRCPRVA